MTVDIELAKYYQEWWKVGVSALTPITIAILTYFIINSLNEKQSELRISEQTLSEKQKTYSNLGRELNIIYCYVSEVGDYKNFRPDEIVKKKREADRTFYIYRPYWSKKTEGAYVEFMKAAFQMYVGPATDAKIRGSFQQKRLAAGAATFAWKPEWNSLFFGDYDTTLPDKYDLLVDSFLRDIASSTVDRR